VWLQKHRTNDKLHCQSRDKKQQKIFNQDLKGLSHDFGPVSLACMDVSGPEFEPLVVFKF
jgi:hypothetical protein